MARAEAYPHANFHLDPSNRLATVHERYRQTDRQTGQDRTGQDNGPIAQGEPFYKRSPKNRVRDCCSHCAYCETMACRRRQCTMSFRSTVLANILYCSPASAVSIQPRIVKDWTRYFEDARDYVTVMTICLLPLTCLMMLTTNCLVVF